MVLVPKLFSLKFAVNKNNNFSLFFFEKNIAVTTLKQLRNVEYRKALDVSSMMTERERESGTLT